MRLVTVKMPEAYVEAIDELVKKGRFTSRSEAIRVAIRELLRREMWIRELPPDEEEEEDVIDEF
ncbi:CopG family transcriptional regulator [Ignicoccus islandicus DSM 13165]|uniref:CopG family transcriptional regulator n=1 Tax=Ignicoccus islandicus DSM 13165 TaxID=940295 RepID=A0A0U2WLW7_9CREN|nr:ribbon-helix-helix domain-containing protein [Ignicoccus islandicus]ALU11921.1 CopG family transcriptional regulator [Ignicoccus islandicus DSM 13165]